MKKPQSQRAASILQAHNKAATPTKHNVCGAHITLNNNIITFSGGGDRCNSGSILISQWQMEKQILNALDTVVGQLAGECRPHTVQQLN